jgi:pilus assembly protein CpaE
MGAGNTPVLVSADRELQRAVGIACTEAGLSAPEVCADVQALERRLQSQAPALALIDLSDAPLIELRRLAPVLLRFPQLQVVLLCPTLESEVLLEAMQMGVRNCVHKPALARDLGPILMRLGQSERPARAASGRSVTVVPARGGSGATTVAINLAQELHASSGEPTLLVDADVHYGSVSTYLSLKARYGLSDVLATGGALDSALLTTTSTVHSEGLHVLVSPVSIDFESPAALVLPNLPRALEVARQHYPWTVVDLPRASMHDTAAVSRTCALTLIVLQLTVHDVRAARALRNALEANGVEANSIVMVANRFRRRGEMLSLDDARQALAGAELVTLANDYESAVRAINLGQTLASVAPRSVLRKDLRELANLLLQRVPQLRAS